MITMVLGCQSKKVDEQLQEVKTITSSTSQFDEKDFGDQIRKVREGASDSIRTTYPITSQILFDELKSLPNLRELVLDGGIVRDEDLFRFIDQVDLTHLRLRASPLTDNAAKRIATTQKNLKIMNVPQCEFGIAGTSAISGLTSLTHLRLGGSRFDDSCVAEISKLESLQSLHLIGPKLTGQSLRDISRMKNLQSFYLDDCRIPDEDWGEFFQTRKDIHVHLDQTHHDRDPSTHPH